MFLLSPSRLGELLLAFSLLSLLPLLLARGSRAFTFGRRREGLFFFLFLLGGRPYPFCGVTSDNFLFSLFLVAARKVGDNGAPFFFYFLLNPPIVRRSVFPALFFSFPPCPPLAHVDRNRPLLGRQRLPSILSMKNDPFFFSASPPPREYR